MSTDNISYQILEDFVKKVRSSSRMKQKQLNIPIDEAENIVYHLNLVLFRLLEKQENKSSDIESIITVSMDGGGFNEKR